MKILSLLQTIQPDFNFKDDVDFVAHGYLDSFDIVQLVAALEKEFGIVISALDILPENFSSIKAISLLVEKSLLKIEEQSPHNV